MFANMFTNRANMFVKFVNMFANLKSVRLDVCLTIFMFVSKTFVNDEFANTKRCSRTSRTHCSRTISVREPCLLIYLEEYFVLEGRKHGEPTYSSLKGHIVLVPPNTMRLLDILPMSL